MPSLRFLGGDVARTFSNGGNAVRSYSSGCGDVARRFSSGGDVAGRFSNVGNAVRSYSSGYGDVVERTASVRGDVRSFSSGVDRRLSNCGDDVRSFSSGNGDVARRYSSVCQQERMDVPSDAARSLKEVKSFKYSDLEVRLVDQDQLKTKPDKDSLQFGKHFTDHMLKVVYKDSEVGWSRPVICPLENISLHPAAKVFHYAIELFEGLKAYRGYDDKIRIFRPELNMARMNISSARSGLPQFEPEDLIKSICRLLNIDKEWVPRSQSASLYIRPTLIATEATLGIGASKSALLYVILSPVGAYFSSGVEPISLLADPKFIRAWPGGVGNIKMGSNYAPTIHVQKKAMNKGHHQVLWLYGDDYQLTEAGTMNLFIVIRNQNGEKELITPPLDGLILPGITRQSILELSQQWGEYRVTERVVTMPEALQHSKDGTLLEMFGSGTACLVSPINGIWFEDDMLKIPTMEQEDPVFGKILTALTDIQYGRVDHPWARVVD